MNDDFRLGSALRASKSPGKPSRTQLNNLLKDLVGLDQSLLPPLQHLIGMPVFLGLDPLTVTPALLVLTRDQILDDIKTTYSPLVYSRLRDFIDGYFGLDAPSECKQSFGAPKADIDIDLKNESCDTQIIDSILTGKPHRSGPQRGSQIFVSERVVAKNPKKSISSAASRDILLHRSYPSSSPVTRPHEKPFNLLALSLSLLLLSIPAAFIIPRARSIYAGSLQWIQVVSSNPYHWRSGYDAIFRNNSGISKDRLSLLVFYNAYARCNGGGGSYLANMQPYETRVRAYGIADLRDVQVNYIHPLAASLAEIMESKGSCRRMSEAEGLRYIRNWISE